jgi:hypothetical protein
MPTLLLAFLDVRAGCKPDGWKWKPRMISSVTRFSEGTGVRTGLKRLSLALSLDREEQRALLQEPRSQASYPWRMPCYDGVEGLVLVSIQMQRDRVTGISFPSR